MKFNTRIRIGAAVISDKSPVFFIAEAGVNHNGSMALAKKLVDIACEAGADAVKFQHFKADNLILKDVPKAPYQRFTTNANESQYEMLKRLELTWKNLLELKDYCRKKGIIFLVTPFDEVSLEELDKVGLPAYKISSTDITNFMFLKKVARKGRPVILSTGMAYLKEIEMALKEIRPFNKDVILLQCTANYPVRECEVNLRTIAHFSRLFDILVGFSDHSLGVKAVSYAVAAGARVVEKHFTLNRSLAGPDHRASLSPKQLRAAIQEVRKLETYLGEADKKPTESELGIRKFLSKYLVCSRAIARGEKFNEGSIIAKRTGGLGIPASEYRQVLNRRSPRKYKRDEIIERRCKI